MNDTAWTTIYLMRHGETIFNTQTRYQGYIDSDLTEEGKAVIRQRAEEFKDIDFDAVYTSDLGRTTKTAEIILLERQLEIKAKELLRERSFGKFEGKIKEELLDEYGHLFDQYATLKGKERMSFTFDGAFEDLESLQNRIFTVLREISLAHPGKNVLVVTSGSLMGSLLGHLDPKYYEMKPANTGYAKIACDGVEFKILETKDILPRQATNK